MKNTSMICVKFVIQLNKEIKKWGETKTVLTPHYEYLDCVAEESESLNVVIARLEDLLERLLEDKARGAELVMDVEDGIICYTIPGVTHEATLCKHELVFHECEPCLAKRREILDNGSISINEPFNGIVPD